MLYGQMQIISAPICIVPSQRECFIFATFCENLQRYCVQSCHYSQLRQKTRKSYFLSKCGRQEGTTQNGNHCFNNMRVHSSLIKRSAQLNNHYKDTLTRIILLSAIKPKRTKPLITNNQLLLLHHKTFPSVYHQGQKIINCSSNPNK